MINYKIINDSIEYYESAGFKRIELPWTVTKPIADITKPIGCDNFTIQEKEKVLVASGEQSFLYLYNKGFLPKGTYQGCTPCFRNDIFDGLHTKYFIKNELIKTDSTTDSDLAKMISTSLIFFKKYMNGVSDLKVVQTGSLSYDIMYEDVELGSYGIRECDFLTWIYGTGVAEPRLTRTMKKYGII